MPTDHTDREIFVECGPRALDSQARLWASVPERDRRAIYALLRRSLNGHVDEFARGVRVAISLLVTAAVAGDPEDEPEDEGDMVDGL